MRRGVIGTAVGVGLGTLTLAGYFLWIGLERADQLASVVGVFIGLLSLLVAAVALRHVGATPPAPAGPTAPDRVVPRHLPPAIRHFAGRATEFDALRAATPDRPGPAPTIITITGTAGIGKTTLAVEWAHRMAAHYPDGQLYANLRGFDPAADPVHPADVVHGFLVAIGAGQIPTGLDDRARLYASLLAGRRMLILLDNARDAAQVRPLLPNSPTVLVLVTSRDELLDLVAAAGAHPLVLNRLSEAESWQLLAGVVGEQRLRAEPDAAASLIELCARLPLALSLTAARAALHPDFPLAAVARELAAAPGEPAWLDAHAALRAAFGCSYRLLDPAGARLFRRLGLHPGPEITTGAAASLAEPGDGQVRPALAALARTHLLEEPAPGRYALHDLVGEYARGLVRTVDPEDGRQESVLRMLDHYLHTAYRADRVLSPNRDPITVPPPRPGAVVDTITDRGAALAWFTAEHPVLLACLRIAAANGADPAVWQLAWSMTTYLDRAGHWHDWLEVQQQALAAAIRSGDGTDQARAHRALAVAAAALDRTGLAATHFQHALDLFTRAGDPAGAAHTHLSAAQLYEGPEQARDALRHDREALRLYQEAGHLVGQARALNALGWDHALLGEHDRTLDYCGRALTLLTELGDLVGQGATWDSLGYARHHLGDYDKARECYRRARELRGRLNDRYGEAEVLLHLADTYQAAGDHDGMREALRDAYTILASIGHRDADQVRQRLADTTR